MDPILKAIGVRKSFGLFEAAKGIDLEIARGEVVCIISPSGSGKSTFLRSINQLEGTSGGVLWVNRELAGYRRVANKLYE